MADLATSTAFPRRPGFGTSGRPLQVRTNFFPVLSLPGQNIHHYSVTVEPETNPRTQRRLYALWEQLNANGILRATRPVFDGRGNIYAPRALMFKGDEARFVLELGEEELAIDSGYRSGAGGERALARPGRGPRKFKVTITKIGEINMHRLHLFLEGKTREAPVEAITALDILLRHRPSMMYTTVGRCFYTPEGSASIANGAELWQGFHQAIRPSQNKMLLNLDVSATAFLEAGPMVDMVAKILGRTRPDDIRQSLNERDRYRVEKALKNVKVTTTHRGDGRRRWKISKITSTPCSRTFFPLQDETGREESVVTYFKERYGTTLRYDHLPCLVVGDPAKHIYLPMEVCRIVPGQRILRKLNEKQTADMIRFTCQPPHVRSNKVSNGFNLLLTQDNKYLQDFNVSIGREMATVNARILPTPTLSYHPNSRESTIAPREGSWNLRDKKVAQGAVLNSWSVIVFGSEREISVYNVQKFLRELITTCRDTGMDIRQMQPPIRHANPLGNIEAILKAAFMDAGNASNHKPQLVLIILPNTGVPLYAEIKRIADTVIGVATQCMQAKHVFAAKKQYCANICLKLNVKLGGMNCFLGNQQLPFVAEKPTIIFGADVTHPAPGDHNKPSIAAIVASVDAQCSRYAAAIRIQKGRQELIRDLQGASVELLRTFYQSCGSKPHRILFYRDGVSEGQFGEIVKEEVAALRRACEQLEAGYRPQISFVIVQKRHHTRFFPLKKEDADKSGNVLPGTVVEAGITHPAEFDFYLASHPGLQGTSKPTHYHVLYDENNFTADGLQELTYRLCYLYCRATRAVSVCPPAYYAHLVAARARFHFMGEVWSDVASERNFGPTAAAVAAAAGLPSLSLEALTANYGFVKPDLAKVMYYM
ncbi:Piwi domain-containing protein [Powellomyces hirtus]|nr:Piwi domain-containing protein [Powellomyces hirtus]